MSVLRAVLDKLTAPGGSPVVRVKGFRRSKRVLTTFFPNAVNPQVVMAGVEDLRNHRLTCAEEDGVFRLRVAPLSGYGAGNINEIASFSTREDVDDAMRRITKTLSPSPWRWLWRLLIALLVLSLIPAPGSRAPRQLPSQAGATPSLVPAPAAPVAPPVAAPLQPGAATPADSADPFGMRTSPASSALSQ